MTKKVLHGDCLDARRFSNGRGLELVAKDNCEKLAMKKDYDSSWDLKENEDGNLPGDQEAFDRIYAEWKDRSWEQWLQKNLKFPFPAKRMEDEDDAYFTDIAKSEPFRLGHVMEAIDIEFEDELYGVILKVKEGKRVGQVPLCDVEVTSKENENYWPVREYVVWFANR